MQRRERHGLSRVHLAARAGMSPRQLARTEAGENLGLALLERLAKALRCTPADLLRPVPFTRQLRALAGQIAEMDTRTAEQLSWRVDPRPLLFQAVRLLVLREGVGPVIMELGRVIARLTKEPQEAAEDLES